MAIDYETETIITLGEACRAFPPNGVSDATMARWIQRGVKVKSLGAFVKLETLLIGGRRVTSREAISKFIAEQNAADVPVAAITPSQQRKQSEAARSELERMGVGGGVNEDPKPPAKEPKSSRRTIAKPTKDYFATTGGGK